MSSTKLHTLNTQIPSIQIQYNFINSVEEQYLINKVDDVGQQKGSGGWTDLNGRRSMYWGGTLAPSGTLIPVPFPSFMNKDFPNILNRIEETQVFSDSSTKDKGKGPNHCLVNEYLPGQGIMAHTDGPNYSPVVATLSLGSHTILTLRQPHQDLSASLSSSTPDQTIELMKPFSVFLPARSLVVLSSTIYSDWLHSIEPIKVDDTDSLKSCINWEDYWLNGGDLLDNESGATENEREVKDLVEELISRRRIIEGGKGWERGRRISLTCRRVDKVRKGLRIG